MEHHLLCRSTDAAKLSELCRRRESEMKHCLEWCSLILFGLGSVIVLDIFLFTLPGAHENVGPASVLSYITSGVSSLSISGSVGRSYDEAVDIFAVRSPAAGCETAERVRIAYSKSIKRGLST